MRASSSLQRCLHRGSLHVSSLVCSSEWFFVLHRRSLTNSPRIHASMQTPGCYELEHLEKTEVLLLQRSLLFPFRRGSSCSFPVGAPVLHLSLFVRDILVCSLFWRCINMKPVCCLCSFVILLIWRGAHLCASVTPQTQAPPRWSGPGRSTYLFFWLETGAARPAFRRTARPAPGGRRCRSAPGHSRRCSCGRCPGRAPPTAGSPSDRGGCRPGTGCGGQWISCTQTSTGGNRANIKAHKQKLSHKKTANSVMTQPDLSRVLQLQLQTCWHTVCTAVGAPQLLFWGWTLLEKQFFSFCFF